MEAKGLKSFQNSKHILVVGESNKIVSDNNLIVPNFSNGGQKNKILKTSSYYDKLPKITSASESEQTSKNKILWKLWLPSYKDGSVQNGFPNAINPPFRNDIELSYGQLQKDFDKTNKENRKADEKNGKFRILKVPRHKDYKEFKNRPPKMETGALEIFSNISKIPKTFQDVYFNKIYAYFDKLPKQMNTVLKVSPKNFHLKSKRDVSRLSLSNFDNKNRGNRICLSCRTAGQRTKQNDEEETTDSTDLSYGSPLNTKKNVDRSLGKQKMWPLKGQSAFTSGVQKSRLVSTNLRSMQNAPTIKKFGDSGSFGAFKDTNSELSQEPPDDSSQTSSASHASEPNQEAAANGFNADESTQFNRAADAGTRSDQSFTKRKLTKLTPVRKPDNQVTITNGPTNSPPSLQTSPKIPDSDNSIKSNPILQPSDTYSETRAAFEDKNKEHENTSTTVVSHFKSNQTDTNPSTGQNATQLQDSADPFHWDENSDLDVDHGLRGGVFVISKSPKKDNSYPTTTSESQQNTSYPVAHKQITRYELKRINEPSKASPTDFGFQKLGNNDFNYSELRVSGQRAQELNSTKTHFSSAAYSPADVHHAPDDSHSSELDDSKTASSARQQTATNFTPKRHSLKKLGKGVPLKRLGQKNSFRFQTGPIFPMGKTFTSDANPISETVTSLKHVNESTCNVTGANCTTSNHSSISFSAETPRSPLIVSSDNQSSNHLVIKSEEINKTTGQSANNSGSDTNIGHLNQGNVETPKLFPLNNKSHILRPGGKKKHKIRRKLKNGVSVKKLSKKLKNGPTIKMAQMMYIPARLTPVLKSNGTGMLNASSTDNSTHNSSCSSKSCLLQQHGSKPSESDSNSESSSEESGEYEPDYEDHSNAAGVLQDSSKQAKLVTQSNSSSGTNHADVNGTGIPNVSLAIPPGINFSSNKSDTTSHETQPGPLDAAEYKSPHFSAPSPFELNSSGVSRPYPEIKNEPISNNDWQPQSLASNLPFELQFNRNQLSGSDVAMHRNSMDPKPSENTVDTLSPIENDPIRSVTEKIFPGPITPELSSIALEPLSIQTNTSSIQPQNVTEVRSSYQTAIPSELESYYSQTNINSPPSQNGASRSIVNEAIRPLATPSAETSYLLRETTTNTPTSNNLLSYSNAGEAMPGPAFIGHTESNSNKTGVMPPQLDNTAPSNNKSDTPGQIAELNVVHYPSSSTTAADSFLPQNITLIGNPNETTKFESNDSHANTSSFQPHHIKLDNDSTNETVAKNTTAVTERVPGALKGKRLSKRRKNRRKFRRKPGQRKILRVKSTPRFTKPTKEPVVAVSKPKVNSSDDSSSSENDTITGNARLYVSAPKDAGAELAAMYATSENCSNHDHDDGKGDHDTNNSTSDGPCKAEASETVRGSQDGYRTSADSEKAQGDPNGPNFLNRKSSFSTNASSDGLSYSSWSSSVQEEYRDQDEDYGKGEDGLSPVKKPGNKPKTGGKRTGKKQKAFLGNPFGDPLEDLFNDNIEPLHEIEVRSTSHHKRHGAGR